MSGRPCKGRKMAQTRAKLLSEIAKYQNSEEYASEMKFALRGENLSVLVVGGPGVGKSTLVNTILMKRVRKTASGPASVTKGVDKQVIPIPLGDGGECSLTVIDTQGKTGKRRQDKQLADELTKLKEVDIILICFDLPANGGRYCPDVHYNPLEWLCNIFNDQAMKQKAMIVLTKGNTYPTRHQKCQAVVAHEIEERPESVQQVVNLWTEMHREEAAERIEDGVEHALCLEGLPTQVAGMLPFHADSGKPDVENMATIDGKNSWHNDLWNAIAERSGGGLAAFMYHEMTALRKSQLEESGSHPKSHANPEPVFTTDVDAPRDCTKTKNFGYPEPNPEVLKKVPRYVQTRLANAMMATGTVAACAGTARVAASYTGAVATVALATRVGAVVAVCGTLAVLAGKLLKTYSELDSLSEKDVY